MNSLSDDAKFSTFHAKFGVFEETTHTNRNSAAKIREIQRLFEATTHANRRSATSPFRRTWNDVVLDPHLEVPGVLLVDDEDLFEVRESKSGV